MNRSRPPRWPIRGIMADPARLIERHEFYLDLLEMMAGWGLNTLWWHFADDEGFMLKLKSHPELAAPHAFSRTGMKRLLARAAELGIDVVPEVESLGHARYMTRLPQYAELADGGPRGFNAICPSHPRTLPLLSEIITEVAGLFPSPCFHAGMDEVDLGDCRRCRRRARGRPGWWVYARHVKAIHRIVKGCGKEMIIWADHVEKAPAMLKVLPRDIIMAHWQYRQVRPEAIRRSLKAGFRVIGAPALCHSGDMIMPNEGNFRNMDAMARCLSPLRPRRAVLGLVNTWWTLWRGLRDAYLPAVAYTGETVRRGGGSDKVAFLDRFAGEFFRLRRPGAGAAIRELHQCMPDRAEVSAALADSFTDLHDALNLAEREALGDRGRRLDAAVAALAKLAKGVRARREEFEALLLAGRVAALCCRQVSELASAVGKYRLAERMHDSGHDTDSVLTHLAAALEVFRRRQRGLDEIAAAVGTEWDRTRYANDPRKGVWKQARFSLDALLAKLVRARRFNAKLVRDLRGAMTTYRRTGRFPAGV